MRRLSGRFRSALVIGLQGIRARKLRTLLSMVSLFLGVLAVVVVQAGASIAERALLANVELTNGIDGTKNLYVPPEPGAASAVLDTVEGRPDATAMIVLPAIIGEPGVRPVNEGAAPFDENWGSSGEICFPDGTCQPNPEPTGQAVEVRLTALTGDVRAFRPYRPYRPRHGQWLDFTTMPAMAPRLVLNLEAAKGFERYRVPAEMRVRGAIAHITPQFVGVIDDGDIQPRAYVRMDELVTWLPVNTLTDPGTGGELQVLMTGSTPVEQVLTSRLTGLGLQVGVQTVDSLERQEDELALIRLVFLAMAGLVLLIGVAGILNVGLATVGERIEEFALRRAVGTPRSLLAGIVLAETLLTGLLTAAAAIGVSVGGLKLVSMMLGDAEPFLQNMQYPWDAGLAGIVAGLIAGILGGFVPALRAARIPIASVMRA
ncbi:ABC transporter permease [Jidongwangia harbinensis]|uniref:ABC transporter permease n=1 Tax=Jidongwangia harbinensis TaxID=2878561 RepID=UPI001CD96277|nr:ABC transporter permease [Jidongwangia harbinensis]MCA2213106.1 ABC transporter permease [Jidongwangia harbinensis]